MNSLSDEMLAKQAQSDDKDAFFTLYHRYLSKVYNRVKSKIPLADAEDVTQDVFIAVSRSLRSYKQEARFNTWLYTIVNRQIADFYRRRGRRSSGTESEVEMETGEQERLISVFDSQEIDQRLFIQRALNALPEHYQDIILMRFADGLTFNEIAEERQQSLEAIKSLYRRAIQAARTAMDEAS
ncbi:MAG: RNA polymerase sigma factor [Anaerolineae bacterium]|nr:RNA polymerase sigma factor [Anaerolineae bacterium]